MRGESSRMEAVLGGMRGRVPELSRLALVPLVLLAVVVCAGLGLVGFRLIAASGAFDVERIEVQGAGGAEARVRDAVQASVGGTSLLQTDPAALAAALATLPQVRSASVDRAFPQTVRVTIVPERAVAIAPNGSERVVLAASGRVLGPVTPGTLGLPLIAAAPGDLPAVGGSVQSAAVLQELRVAAAPRRGLRFTAIGFTADGLTGRTAQGLDIRLGDDEDLAAKLRVARSVLRRAGAGADYIDVSVPGAPVLRQSAGEPLTVDAPPPVAPALPTGADGDAGGNWSSGASPAESIRTLFG